MAAPTRLPNGINIVCDPRPGSGKVEMQVYIRAGSYHEAPEEAGLTNLTQEACNGGTTTLSRNDLADAIESKGTALYTAADHDSTYFGLSALTKDVPALFALLSDVVRNPAFDPEEVEQTRQLIDEALDEESQNPAALRNVLFQEAALIASAPVHNPMGTKELLHSFTVEQVRRRHRELLACPEDIIVSFSGDIDIETANALAVAHFGDMRPAPEFQRPAPTPLRFHGADIRVPNDNAQVNLTIGFPAPPRTTPERFDFLLLNELLGGGMSCPLFQEIRDRRGLVYSVSSSYAPQNTTGLFKINAGMDRGKVRELVGASIKLLGDAARGLFTADLLDEARARYKESLNVTLEKATSAAMRNAMMISNFGRVITTAEIMARLQQVTPDDIRRAACSLLKSGQYALSAVGPQEDVPPESEIRALIDGEARDLVTLPLPAARAEISPDLFVSSAQVTASSDNIRETTLSNGMRIVTTERPGSLSCGIWIGTGAAHETERTDGIKHMIEHMMFRGTESYPGGRITEIVEGVMGGDVNAYTSIDTTGYYFYALREPHLGQALDMLAEMVYKARFDKGEYEGRPQENPDDPICKGERSAVLEEISMYRDDVDSRLSLYGYRAVAFPGQSHGHSILGSRESLLALTADDLRADRDEFYGPNNAVVSVTGPVRHEDVVALMQEKCGALAVKPVPPFPPARYTGGTSYIEMDSAKLCNVTLAMEGVTRDDPDYYAYEMLSEILGTGASSRLTRSLVNGKRLLSGIYASHTGDRSSSLFCVDFKTEASRLKTVLGAVYQEIRQTADTLTEEEIQKVRNIALMRLMKKMETNRGHCDHYGRKSLDGCPLQTPEEVTNRFSRVTKQDLQRVAATILSSAPALAAVVPVGTEAALLPDLAELEKLRDGILPEKHVLDSPRPAV